MLHLFKFYRAVMTITVIHMYMYYRYRLLKNLELSIKQNKTKNSLILIFNRSYENKDWL